MRQARGKLPEGLCLSLEEEDRNVSFPVSPPLLLAGRWAERESVSVQVSCQDLSLVHSSDLEL